MNLKRAKDTKGLSTDLEKVGALSSIDRAGAITVQLNKSMPADGQAFVACGSVRSKHKAGEVQVRVEVRRNSRLPG